MFACANCFCDCALVIKDHAAPALLWGGKIHLNATLHDLRAFAVPYSQVPWPHSLAPTLHPTFQAEERRLAVELERRELRQAHAQLEAQLLEAQSLAQAQPLAQQPPSGGGPKSASTAAAAVSERRGGNAVTLTHGDENADANRPQVALEDVELLVEAVESLRGKLASREERIKALHAQLQQARAAAAAPGKAHRVPGGREAALQRQLDAAEQQV